MRTFHREGRSLALRAGLCLINLLVAAVVCVLIANGFVVGSTAGNIAAEYESHEDALMEEEMAELKSLDADCIIVLGASVHTDGTPSPMLKDRLDTAVRLYEEGLAPKLLLTGDSGQEEYNEVGPMARYVVGQGVDPNDIFCDYAGFSTYESAYRAEKIFQVERAIVVTQQYHLYRALYGCERMGIQVLGAAANQQKYSGRQWREAREVLARTKDFFKWMIKPRPTYLGEQIPITGPGNTEYNTQGN